MSEYVLNTPPPEHMKEKNAPEKCGHPGTPVRDLEDREQFSEAVTPARQLLGRPSPPPPPPPAKATTGEKSKRRFDAVSRASVLSIFERR
mmetsp:Transcript_11116/g.16674  ORF Transcript_11116/g.16674 Transcript_11116/m.16674 type:complete len:90 (-) Transcript_11116:979-1248(-)